VRGRLFQTRGLLLALRAGEPYRLSRSIACETVTSSFGGTRTWKRTRDLAGRASALARATGRPHAVGWSISADAVAHYLAGDYKKAAVLCDEAESLFRDQTKGMAWEVATVQMFGLRARFFLGDLTVLRERGRVALREAVDRGDLYGAVNLRIGHLNAVCLLDDDIGEAIRRVDDAMRQWSKSGFHMEHYDELVARANIDLYAGDAVAAHRRIAERWPALERSLVLRVQLVRIGAWHVRARAALALAERDPALRDDLVARALADAGRIARERSRFAEALALLVRASAACVRGERAETKSIARRAIAALEAEGLLLYAASLRLGLARSLGEGEGKADTLRDEALTWMTAREVKDPARVAAMLVPGFGG
jgi:hypothetical protein